MNGMKVGKSRLYFKKGTHENKEKHILRRKISRFESPISDIKVCEQKREIIRIFKLSSNSDNNDNVILGILHVHDIINDLIKK